MNRADALAYLVPRVRGTAVVVGLGLDDSATGLGPAIDDALAALGLSGSAVVPPSQEAGYKVLLRLYGLQLVQLTAAGKVDITLSDPGISKRYSQLVTNLAPLVGQAQAEAIGLGVLATAGKVIEAGRVSLDYLEPSASVAGLP